LVTLDRICGTGRGPRKSLEEYFHEPEVSYRVPVFAEAFQCKASDAMVREEAKRCQIW
jgi:hypothetical protein